MRHDNASLVAGMADSMDVYMRSMMQELGIKPTDFEVALIATRQTVHNWTTGTSTPSMMNLVGIADLFSKARREPFLTVWNEIGLVVKRQYDGGGSDD